MTIKRALFLLVAGTIVAGPVLAAPPPWAGGGRHEQAEEHGRGHGEQERGREMRGERREHFGDRHVTVVRQYYGNEFHRGACPPGLAKKHNGCMPPGQAKKWRVGAPLPPNVVYYDLPPALVVELGRPPAGYKYVRVAADILMVAVGSSMVVDAIQDLGRM